jgi:uncharacterized protein (TIGR00251 family)
VIERDGDDVLIRIKAVPGASRDEIAGAVGDRLKVRVSAPPQAGRANAAICRLVAAALGVKARRVTVERGHAGAEKVLRVAGCDAGFVRAALG